jgi:amino acid adenylation domain-containing protein
MDNEKTQVSFERILSLEKVTRVVASNGGNLRERIHRWVELGFLEEEDKSDEKEIKRHTPRPALMSPYVAPGTPIEKTVAEIFQNMFGYERIGINDDFFELGLDSIKAIQIRILMNKKGYDIELPDFFNYPTISKLVPLITTVKTTAAQPGTTITGETYEQLKSRYPAPVQDIYPLTPMQEGMLFHSLYETQNIQAYLEQFTFRLQGDLQVPLVEKSVNELVGRHDILRTAFVHEDMERPVQVVLKERAVDFFFKDIRSGAAREDREKETIIKQYIEKEKQYSFDLGKDKLMRVMVIRKEEDEYIFVLTYHHILMDGWSLGIFISEFFAIYNSYIQNKTYPLPPTRPFRTYIDWIESKNKTGGKNFWKTYLEGYEEMASIPKKNSHKAKYLAREDKYTDGMIEATLEKEKTQHLHQMAARNHVTLNTVFQSVWSIVLAAYSGKLEAEKADVVFGSVVSGRPYTLEGVDRIVGCFINTIPVRVCFNYRTTFKQLLEEVQAKAIQCEPYHYYSLAEIQNQSPLKQNLLDHFLEFQNYPTVGQIGSPGQRTWQNDTAETYSISNFRVFEQGNYEFVFSINPGDRLSLQFNYNINAYDNDLIARLGRHTLNIIDQVTRDEEIFIGKITLLTEAEKRQVLYEFNHKGSLPGDRGICQLLENRAASYPDWTAVTFGDRWLTYGRLMGLSRGLAVELQCCGIQKDRTVGILMERSLTMIAAILGVWKAGGAYIPLEPQEPLKRITGILQDSGTTVLITREEPVHLQLQEAYQGKIIQFKDARVDSAPHPGPADIKANRDMNCLAYVIYTSGSTGIPKGAMIEHGGMTNHIQAKIHDLKITENSVIAQNASHTFDISVWQFYAALVPGGRTVIYPNPLILEPQHFINHLIKNRVTILEVVPSYMAMILDSLDAMTGKESFDAVLEYLLVTGEEIQPSLIKRWRERYPGIKMVNAYGPTEASDDITHYFIDTVPGNEPASVPIGKPLQNLKIYIVNPCMQLCPIGIKGEICVSGIGVGRGYLNEQGKTRQSFMKDPFAEETGLKLYKTGDLGLWLPDGTIEFVGRKDTQVKVRGFRIELGEIENRLLTHGKIKEAVVLVREENNDKYLCAYIVAKPGETLPIDQTAIRKYLSNRLPDYMVPSYFVQLDRIPLTPNGKVDRKSLPAPVLEAGEHYEAPRDPIEKKLVGLWTEILEVGNEKISIEANFFHLGGHSIKAMVLASRIHKEFNINVPLGEIFKTPHIRGLAAYIKKSARSIHFQVEPVEKKEYYPLSSAQRRLYIVQRMDTGKGIAYNIPGVWQVEGEISEEKMQRSFRQLIRRHEDLRTFFAMVNSEPVQRIHDEVEFNIEYKEVEVGDTEGTRGLAPLSEESAALSQESEADIISSFIRPFDLSRAPLLRVGLVKFRHTPSALRSHPSQEGRSILMVDMHHIISDGMSMGILVKDFIELYTGMTVTGLRLQYKDYSQWQNQQVGRESIKQQETYWINRFSGEIPVLELPTDYPRPVVQDFTGAAIHFEIGKKETDAVKTLAHHHDVTLFMLLLSFYTVFLGKLSGQEDVVVGIPTAGRRHTDLQGIIGMFVNTLALRNFPVMKKTFARFLGEIKENTIKAFENQDYQYEDLVERVKVVRDTGRNPLFDTMFTLQNMETPDIRLPQNIDTRTAGLKVVPYQYEGRISKFDLTLMAEEQRDRLAFTFEYCTKLFKPETINRFIHYFNKTISTVCDNHNIRISGIEIVGDQEKNRILHEFNDTAADYPKDKTIQQLFKEQVERTPDHMAIIGPKHHARQSSYRFHQSYMSYISITYRHLDQKSHQLVGMLKQKNVGPDSIVGIMAERSIEMIIGILAILQAGGAYLPIETDYPEERKQYMLADSSAGILLTTADLSGKITFGKEILHLPDAINSVPTPHLHLSPALVTSLAYIIYTSGSTGNPRGVMVRQSSVVNLLWAMQGRYPLGEGDTYLLKTSYLFDVSVTELFGWFLEGGRLAVLEPGGEKDPKAILEMIARQRVTHINFVPSMFYTFAETLNPGEIAQLAGLKYIFLAGEALLPGPVNLFRGLNTTIALENIYGPTEAAVYTSWYSLAGGTEDGPVPIGKPLPNVTLYIFNKWGGLQPIGVPGELYISGAGLARGYLNNPELTARLFEFYRSYLSYKSYVLYKTGDWAQWLGDGNIQYLGRIDHQVKIRGFRIELGEIESRLMKHEDIKETVVLAQTYENGDRYLCAYIVAARDLPVPELREYLLDRLPGYMIPSEFVQLEKIPLTKSGKLDRQKLKSVGKRLRTGVEHVAPQSANQVIIADAWKNVLKLEEVGIYDNFFDIGGTSLDMIRLNSKLTEIFKQEIPIIAMYRYTTIDSFTRFLESGNGETENNPAGTRSKEREDRIKKGREDKNKRREIRTRRNK